MTGPRVALLVLAAVLGSLGYAAACWYWPYTYCRRCGGSGKSRAPWGTAYRRCRCCKGSGERLRIGHRVLRWLLSTD